MPRTNGDQGGEGRDLRIAARGQFGQGERRQQQPQQQSQQHLVVVKKNCLIFANCLNLNFSGVKSQLWLIWTSPLDTWCWWVLPYKLILKWALRNFCAVVHGRPFAQQGPIGTRVVSSLRIRGGAKWNYCGVKGIFILIKIPLAGFSSYFSF